MLSIRGRFYSLLGNCASKKYIKNGNNNIIYKTDTIFFDKLNDNNIVDLVTVAFNNSTVIKAQSQLVKKFFKDNYNYCVFDNSTNETESKKIKDFCIKNKLDYVKIKNSGFKKPSENHAIALNFIYYEYINKRKAKYFGIIDHDIFPTKDYKIMNILDEQPFFGYLKENQHIKYLWPGFCFFRFDYCKDKKINFMTKWSLGGDVGSSNYKTLYNKKIDNYKYASFERHNILDGENAQNCMYSILDNCWVHLLNGGNWAKAKDFEKKQKLFGEMINKITKTKVFDEK